MTMTTTSTSSFIEKAKFIILKDCKNDKLLQYFLNPSQFGNLPDTDDIDIVFKTFIENILSYQIEETGFKVDIVEPKDFDLDDEETVYIGNGLIKEVLLKITEENEKQDFFILKAVLDLDFECFFDELVSLRIISFPKI